MAAYRLHLSSYFSIRPGTSDSKRTVEALPFPEYYDSGVFGRRGLWPGEGTRATSS